MLGIKLLFRLDYPVSFAYMDHPGTALNFFGDMSGKVWKSVGEGKLVRSFVAEHQEDGSYRNFTMEPKSLSGEISISGGIQFDQIHSDQSFRLIGGIVNDFMKEFQIRELSRCGIRYICLAKVGGDAAQKLSRALKAVDGSILAAASSELGTPKDIAVTLEGQNEAGIDYRTIFGPLFEKDVKKHLGRLEPNEADIEYLVANDLIFDIDLWETDFTFTAKSFFRWCDDKHVAASAFVKEITSTIHELNVS